MTIQQIYNIINHLGYSATQSIEEYERFTKFPNIFKNIEILINDLIPYYGIAIPDLNKKYDRFPISKINVKLCENDANLVTKLFKYDNHTYKEFSRGGYGFVYGNTETNQAIKRIKWNVKTEPDIFKMKQFIIMIYHLFRVMLKLIIFVNLKIVLLKPSVAIYPPYIYLWNIVEKIYITL